jgi:predicted NAD/FAD-binding protein
MPSKIAIIGGGIAGLTAAYLLNQKFEVKLFEKSDRLGGNAYTHDTKDGETIDMAVGSYSKLISEEFFKILAELNIESILQPASSFLSIHDLETKKGIYLTPFNLKGLITQNFAIYRPLLVSKIIKALLAMRRAVKLLDKGKLSGLSMAEVFNKVPGLKGSATMIMAPLCLLSSMYYEEVMKAPAEFFIGKMKAFQLFLPSRQALKLYFPKNFTRSYVNAIASGYKEKVVLNSTIKSVLRHDGKVTIKMENGEEAVFDKVVFACNADQALALLENPTDQERNILSVWKYKEGLMVAHKDDTHFPKRELCQSWTCLKSTKNGHPHFSISICCWLSSPAVSNHSKYFCTQHPNFPIKEELIDFQKHFRTPIFDFESFQAQKSLPSLNGTMNSYYCGSHFGLGLHNDAVSSAIKVANLLGIDWG